VCLGRRGGAVLMPDADFLKECPPMCVLDLDLCIYRVTMKNHLTNILVVDDDDLLAEMLKIQLEKKGFKVRLAQNGKQALQSLKESTPDLLITDIFMDEMDGIELTAHLKKFHPNIKIIAMSGKLESVPMSFLAMARALGAHRALQKPFDLPSLLKLISELETEAAAGSSNKPPTDPH
jgi:two-component system response regulator GlrR